MPDYCVCLLQVFFRPPRNKDGGEERALHCRHSGSHWRRAEKEGERQTKCRNCKSYCGFGASYFFSVPILPIPLYFICLHIYWCLHKFCVALMIEITKEEAEIILVNEGLVCFAFVINCLHRKCDTCISKLLVLWRKNSHWKLVYCMFMIGTMEGWFS